MTLSLVPVRLSDASAFVAQWHRHHKPPVGGLWAHGIASEGEVVGVAVVGRPSSRMLDDTWTVEVTRCAVAPDTPNGCSMLYRAAWRAAKAMGYKRLVTYTLPQEGGASLRASGFTLIGEAGGGSWSRKERPRIDKHPTQMKLRWEISA